MEELYKYLNQITTISDNTWALIKVIFVKKELKKLDYFFNVDKVATKIAFLQEGIACYFYTNSEKQELNKNFLFYPLFRSIFTPFRRISFKLFLENLFFILILKNKEPLLVT